MLGPVIGGLLGAIAPTAPLYVAALLTVLNVAWVYLAMPESLPADRKTAAWTWQHLNPFAPLARAVRIATLRTAFAAAFLFFFAGALMQSTMSVFLKDNLNFGPIGIGWILFTVGVMDIVSQGVLTGRLLPLFGERALAGWGLFVNAAGFAMIACVTLLPNVGFLIVAVTVFTLGDGLFQPSISGIIANAAPADAQGLVQGANQAQQSLARMSGPLLAAVLYPIDSSLPCWGGAIATLLAIAFLSFPSRATQTVNG
jgi:DHA1 family tetracycline resistance protein-like MFS transporter